MEYKISNDQFIIEYEGFRIIMELKEKFFAQYLKSRAPEKWVDLQCRSLILGILLLPG